MRFRTILVSVALFAFLSVPSNAQRLLVISWNLESGESSDTFIANRVKTFQGLTFGGSRKS